MYFVVWDGRPSHLAVILFWAFVSFFPIAGIVRGINNHFETVAQEQKAREEEVQAEKMAKFVVEDNARILARMNQKDFYARSIEPTMPRWCAAHPEQPRNKTFQITWVWGTVTKQFDTICAQGN